MLGTGGGGMHLMSKNGDDRFYSAARARRSRNRNQSSHQDRLKRAQSDVTGSKLGVFNNQLLYCVADVEVEVEEDVKSSSTTVALPEEALLPPLQLCNFERFLKSVVPSVPAQYPSQRTIREWKSSAMEFRPHFVLGDLFESFKEWSAYGVGVPLILNDSFSVVQYYVPYLSGIQLYGDLSKSLAKSRQPGEDSDDGGSLRDSSSDWSSDCENCMTSPIHSHKQRLSEKPLGRNQLSLRDLQMNSPEDFSSDESEPGSSQGCLLFEYFEKDNPYGREPLAEKISQLALRFPELKSLRSCDLLPTSWISVAWYPIYRIPMGHTLRDLDACFLTFHCLHTPMTGNEMASIPQVSDPSEMVGGIPKISLPAFGLACYKFKAASWIPSSKGFAHELFTSLVQAAETWITQLQVNHPDFVFFRRS